MEPLPYRTVFSTAHGHPDAAAVVENVLRGWLAGKRYEVGDIEEGSVELAPNATLHCQTRSGVWRRWQFCESMSGNWGSWLVTVVSASDESAGRDYSWLQLDVEHLPSLPGGTSARALAPRLASDLMQELGARDGEFEVLPHARSVSAGRIGDLIDQLCDPGRRFPVVVAVAPAAASFKAWTSTSAPTVLRHLPGLAIMHVLRTGAAVRLNREFEFHQVFNGALRTFLPGVDPAWPEDARRHPVMTRGTVEADPARAARIVSLTPQRAAVNKPLPAALQIVVDGAGPRGRPEELHHGA
ncbi:hypothetical protein [Streptomyces sp. TLI_171]|uniref:hypothetical protein n=1 Tax=Streptomyces sp. TLI_171 TaxID=1938859 RepID=UPI000C1959E2|nr:hypothetical protein [Streptomyces sp. TLI_171]RKE22163.1 hypothetical protein BX266_5597 [Streptomyces sp. TLI_171]